MSASDPAPASPSHPVASDAHPPPSALPPRAHGRAARRRARAADLLRRCARDGATAASLFVCAAAVALWARSWAAADVLAVDRPGGGLDEVWTSHGTLGLRHVAADPAAPAAGRWRASYRESRYRDDFAYHPRMSESWDGDRVGVPSLHLAAVGSGAAARNRAALRAAEQGFAAALGPGPIPRAGPLPAAVGPARARLDAVRRATWHRLSARVKVAVPLWAVAGAAAAGPVCRVAVRWRRQRRARPGGFPVAATPASPTGFGPAGERVPAG